MEADRKATTGATADAASVGAGTRPKLLLVVIVILAFDLLRTASRLSVRLSNGSADTESDLFLVWIPVVHMLLLLPAVVGLWRLANWGAWAAVTLLVLRSGQAVWFASTYWTDPVLGMRAPMELANTAISLAIGAYLLLLLKRGIFAR